MGSKKLDVLVGFGLLCLYCVAVFWLVSLPRPVSAAVTYVPTSTMTQLQWVPLPK